MELRRLEESDDLRRWNFSSHGEALRFCIDNRSGAPRPQIASRRGKARLRLETEILKHPRDYLMPGKYKFEILVAASNREPVAYLIEMHGFTVGLSKR
jgi:hypothetical protein